MIRRSFLTDVRGAAAVEMALVLPLVFILLFGALEAGNFVWTQHKLIKAVRDGSRFAARTPIDQLCSGTTSVISSAKQDQIKLLTRTGQIASSSVAPTVPSWTDAMVDVSLTPGCGQFVSTGIYTQFGANGSIVTVKAINVPYRSLFGSMGFSSGTNFLLTAKSSAPVIGL